MEKVSANLSKVYLLLIERKIFNWILKDFCRWLKSLDLLIRKKFNFLLIIDFKIILQIFYRQLFQSDQIQSYLLCCLESSYNLLEAPSDFSQPNGGILRWTKPIFPRIKKLMNLLSDFFQKLKRIFEECLFHQIIMIKTIVLKHKKASNFQKTGFCISAISFSKFNFSK